MFSRRSFIKGVGLVAATPLLADAVQAEALFSGSDRLVGLHQILTCNIRVDLPEDKAAGYGWESRKMLCIELIKKQKPDIIALQEVLANQNEDLKKAFPDYMSLGFEGPEMDEFKEGYHGIAKNPIFFSKKRYELLGSGTFWLSETPLKAGSLSWGSARARNASWLRLKDKRSGVDFRVVNLHLDHVAQQAREAQVRMIMDEAAQYPVDYPQILTGDFNSGMKNEVYSLIKAANWNDTYTAVHGEEEPGFTAHAFKGEAYETKAGKKIDFIFLKGKAEPVSARILKDKIKGQYPSDHYFVSSEVRL